MRKFWIMVFSIPLFFFCTFTGKDHFCREKLQGVLSGEGESIGFDIAGPLTYLGNGNEAIAFLTPDKNYVIKFFFKRGIAKEYRFKPVRRLKQLFIRQEKKDRGVEGIVRYEKAFELLPQETGLIAIHLKKSKDTLPHCTLIDYLGKKHEVDLNELAFVVQKKGDILYDRYRVTTEMRTDFRELFNVITDKGFRIRSSIFFPYNYAFCEGKTILIDLGKLEFAPESLKEKEKLLGLYDLWVERKAKR